MSFLLRTDSGYRICYGEPKRPYVITSNGSHFCAKEFQRMVDEEKEVSCHTAMDLDNFPINNWADVSENNNGISLTDDIADYLLEGKYLAVDTYVELLTNPPAAGNRGVGDDI